MHRPVKLRVFYSWQSDLPKRTNINAIRDALKAAKKTVEANEAEIEVILDEATRDRPGSPNIAISILDKIEASDIVVADITTITPASDGARPCPNPNVVFELGYAVGEVGWDRIVLLFNEAFGCFPDDLPFDFRAHRGSPYRLAETDAKGARKPLENLLTAAIQQVIRTQPKRPAELRGRDPEKVRHEHDVKNLKWLMRTLNIPRLSGYITELPRVIEDQQFYFFEDYNGVVTNPLFTLYDTPLLAEVQKLARAWDDALSYAGHYRDTPGGHRHVFDNPMDLPLRPAQQKVWDAIEASRTDMHDALQAILTRLRADYLEVDLRKTNKRAWSAYVEHQSEIEREEKAASKAAKRSRKALKR